MNKYDFEQLQADFDELEERFELLLEAIEKAGYCVCVDLFGKPVLEPLAPEDYKLIEEGKV